MYASASRWRMTGSPVRCCSRARRARSRNPTAPPLPISARSVAQRRLRDTPPAVHLADHVVVWDAHVGQEHLVEVGDAVDLAQRPHLDAGRASCRRRKYVMPWCFGTSGSVRASKMPSRCGARPSFQTFCPLTTHSSPSRTARVRSPARSEPGARLAEQLAPHLVAAQQRREVPLLLLLGAVRDERRPDHPDADGEDARVDVEARLLLGEDARLGSVPPRPPYSFGHAIPAQPSSYKVRCHSLQWRTCSASASGLGSPRNRKRAKSSSPERRGRACASRNARARARKRGGGILRSVALRHPRAGRSTSARRSARGPRRRTRGRCPTPCSRRTAR